MIEDKEREADASDRATQREQEIVSDALANIARRPSLPDTGHCYNCDDPTVGGRRFCDVDCREDYELRMKLKGGHAGAN